MPGSFACSSNQSRCRKSGLRPDRRPAALLPPSPLPAVVATISQHWQRLPQTALPPLGTDASLPLLRVIGIHRHQAIEGHWISQGPNHAVAQADVQCVDRQNAIETGVGERKLFASVEVWAPGQHVLPMQDEDIQGEHFQPRACSSQVRRREAFDTSGKTLAHPSRVRAGRSKICRCELKLPPPDQLLEVSISLCGMQGICVRPDARCAVAAS